jgi:hypothetical protein
MTGINHKQAQRYLRAATDGFLRENQRAVLDAHLRDCDSCRAEADELNALEARLQKNFQVRWDANDGPSTNVMTTIQSRSRRIIMTNRINTGLKTLAGIVALLLLVLLFNPVFKQLQEYSEQGASFPDPTTFTPHPSTSTQSISIEELSTPDSPPLISVREAEALAGFDVLEPSYLPEGYIFSGASYNSGARWVALEFISQPDGSDYSKVIYIYQRRGAFDLEPALHPYETPVPIGDVEGVFIQGAYVSESPDTMAYRWDASADSYALSWKIDDMAFSINFLGGETTPPISLADLVAIAESMK